MKKISCHFGDERFQNHEFIFIMFLICIFSSVGQEVVRGYDFLVNAVWPEIASSLDTRTHEIFFATNPDLFHEVSTVVLSQGHMRYLRASYAKRKR